MKKLILVLLFLLYIPSLSFAATTWYVKPTGGTATQCTGTTDAAYPGTGTNQPCAFSHPYWALSPQGTNPTKMTNGDTLIIDGTGGAQYMYGLNAPNTATCSTGWPWDCWQRSVPSGIDAAHPTRILGKGWDTGCTAPPQLWGNERSLHVMDLEGSNNIEVQCLEITDHADCGEFAPVNGCKRDTYPFGPWANAGILASDSSNVLLKNVNIHGMAHTGINAGRLHNWVLDHTNITGNAWVGWDGDISHIDSSNTGTMQFSYVNIQRNGCIETYPGGVAHFCFSQDQGGYGDGLGTYQTGADWFFDHVNASQNVSDGIDLAYHRGGGIVNATNSYFGQNSGNQFKASQANMTLSNNTFDGDCTWLRDNNYVVTSIGAGFNVCRAEGNTTDFDFGVAGMQVKITNSAFTNVKGTAAILTTGGACDGTEIMGVDAATTFQLLTRWDGSKQSVKYYAGGISGNADGPCAALKLTTIPSGTCTSNGSCNAATPACGQTTTGTDNCGIACTWVGAACPTCTPDGSCSAATPACGRVTSGVDNCGNICSRTGAACPPTCVSNGGCSAIAPACGQTTTGVDNCNQPCTRTGPACCVFSTCTAPPPNCGQVTSGLDNCGVFCTLTGAPCPLCVPNGSCSAPEPACNQITTGVDNCGTSCRKTGTACISSNSLLISMNTFLLKTSSLLEQVIDGATLYILGYEGHDFRIIEKSPPLPSPSLLLLPTKAQFKRTPSYYTTQVIQGAAVFIMNFNYHNFQVIPR